MASSADRGDRYAARLEHVADLYRQGLKIREIAALLGYGPRSVPSQLVRDARRRGLIGYRYYLDDQRRPQTDP